MLKLLLALLLGVFSSAAFAAAPVPSCTANRTTGVAPLYVFVDCTATTDADTSRPFHDLIYEHSFGDTNAGLWLYGANLAARKNFASGPVAGHIYETAGTYTIRPVVRDGTTTKYATPITVTVTAADTAFSGANTTCFSNSAVFTGCPSGATQVTTSNWTTAIGYHTTSKRLLFKRGDTFTVATAPTVDVAGPGLIGDFGTGAKPVVSNTGNTTALYLSSPQTPTMSDWRVTELMFDGLSGVSSAAIRAAGTIKQLTLHKLTIHHSGYGVEMGASTLNYNNNNGFPGHTLHDQLAITDSYIHHILNGENAIFTGATRVMIAGNNLLDTSAGQHVVRMTTADRMVLSNNDISTQANGYLLLKLHGPTWCDAASPPGSCYTPDSVPPSGGGYGYATNTAPIDVTAPSPYTEKVVISGNRFIDAVDDWSVALGPQNAQKDERVRNVIVERNYFAAGTSTQVTLLIWGTDMTVRNNMFNTSTALSMVAVRVEQHSVEPPPNNNVIVNNTFYTSGTTGGTGNYVPIIIQATASNTTAKNNIAYGPTSTARTMIQDAGTGTIGASGTFGNSSNAQILVDPVFDSLVTPPAGFRIGITSYGLNGGVNLYPSTDRDFYNCTDKNGNLRMGAFVPRVYAKCRGGR